MKKSVRKASVKGASKFNWLVFVACLLIVFAVAAVGSVFTSSNTGSEWYKSIKPSITPPNFVFPIVWSILFLLIGISLYFAWMNGKNKLLIGILFGINFVLNILWSVFYFQMRGPLFAFIEIIFLWFSILAMMIVSWKANSKAGWMLLPYLLWVSFAAVLNFLSI